MKNATRCGISALEFWELTPVEIHCVVEGYLQSQKELQEQQLTLAYVQALWTAQWFGKRKPKSLESILEKTRCRKKKPMSAEDMLEKVKQLNAMFGGELTNG